MTTQTVSAPAALSPVRPRHMGGLLGTLMRARFTSGGVARWLPILASAGFAISTWLTLTVAGGTWMLYQRTVTPPGFLGEVVRHDKGALFLLQCYVALALIACALTVGPLVSLAAGAARLGARTVERRLAVLRLVGLSSRDVTRLCVGETAIFAVVGALLGSVLYVVTLPAWRVTTIEAVQIGSGEMLLPVGGWAAINLIIVAIGVVSSWFGLAQVRISPLGVARRSLPRALKVWRLVAFVAALVLFWVMLPYMFSSKSVQAIWPFALVALALLLVIGGINLVMPWVLQQLAKLGAQMPWASVMTANRRIQMDPKATWRRVGPVSIVCFIAGMVGVSPVFGANVDLEEPLKTMAAAIDRDIPLGIAITMVITFIAAAFMVLSSAASDILERAEQSRALYRMGAPMRYLARTAWFELVIPLLGCLPALGLGYLLASPMRPMVEKVGIETHSSAGLIWGAMIIGLVLIVTSQISVEPLRRATATLNRRRND